MMAIYVQKLCRKIPGLPYYDLAFFTTSYNTERDVFLILFFNICPCHSVEYLNVPEDKTHLFTFFGFYYLYRC